MNKHFQQESRSELLRPGYFLLIALVFLGIGIWQLRQNNLRMSELRSQVYAADKEGKGVEQALQNLRAYVNHHMNTDLSTGENGVYPPIQLKYTYERLIKKKGQQATDYNSQIYTDAQKYCEGKIPTGFSGRYRISCIQKYVKSHNASLAYISPSLYEFSFYSPTWSPDLAGWSLVLAAILFLLAAGLWLRRWASQSRHTGARK